MIDSSPPPSPVGVILKMPYDKYSGESVESRSGTLSTNKKVGEGGRKEIKKCLKKVVSHFSNYHNFFAYLCAGNYSPILLLFCVLSNDMLNLSIGTFS